MVDHATAVAGVRPRCDEPVRRCDGVGAPTWRRSGAAAEPSIAGGGGPRRRGAGDGRRGSCRAVGPRTIAGGVLSVVGLVGGWWCLRAAVDADEAQA
jgi:hypothetical protein